MKRILLMLFITGGILTAQDHIRFLSSVPDSFANNYKIKNAYNPLQVGDIYQTQTSDGRHVNVWIEKDTVINSNRYYKKNYQIHAYTLDYTTNYERNDSLSKASYKLDFEDVDEDMQYDDELLIDSLTNASPFYDYLSYRYRWKKNYGWMLEPSNVRIYDSSWVVVWGDTCKAKLIEYIDIYMTRWVTDKFGKIIGWSEGPYVSFLSGAVINGVQYGEIVSDVEMNNEVPKKWILSQNYPNPFNPQTTINFSVPSRELVSIKLFDILVQEVSTLINEIKEPGSYSFNFDGSNLSNGVYIYRMQAGNFVESKKMILLK